MSNSVLDAVEALYAALATVEGVRVHRRLGESISPPGTALSPPTLQRQAMGSDPTNATFKVAVVVAESDQAMTEALRLEPLVAAALDALPNVAVGVSEPGSWQGLDAYVITVEYGL